MKRSAAIGFACLVLLAGCGDAPAAPEPAPEERLAALRAEITRIEAICVPERGTTRAEVEAAFGKGEPLRPAGPKGSVRAEAPSTSSPRYAYYVCEDGTLDVWYGENDEVRRAGYLLPRGTTRGTLFRSSNASPAQQEAWLPEDLRDAERRLKQMKRVLAAWQSRQER